MDSSNIEKQHQQFQNVLVMRHSDRIDYLEPMWAMTADRSWDPPLAEAGKLRAFCTGKKLGDSLGFPIHRVFVSPFLRCLQTASEIISAFCTVDDDHLVIMNSETVVIDASKIKASVEYGLCEVLNKQVLGLEMAPKNENFCFNLAECEAKLPVGTVDPNVERVYQELPKWEEPVGLARTRYFRTIKALADKYPLENLLLITHGYGVGFSVSEFMPDHTNQYKVEFCGYSQLQRPIIIGENNLVTAGNFKLLPGKDQTGYYHRRPRIQATYKQPLFPPFSS